MPGVPRTRNPDSRFRQVGSQARTEGTRPMPKLSFIVGLTAGYVLGARAGKQRYAQIKKVSGKVWQSKPVQKQVAAAKESARTKAAPVVADFVADAAKTTPSSFAPPRPSPRRSGVATDMTARPAATRGSRQPPPVARPLGHRHQTLTPATRPTCRRRPRAASHSPTPPARAAPATGRSRAARSASTIAVPATPVRSETSPSAPCSPHGHSSGSAGAIRTRPLSPRTPDRGDRHAEDVGRQRDHTGRPRRPVAERPTAGHCVGSCGTRVRRIVHRASAPLNGHLGLGPGRVERPRHLEPAAASSSSRNRRRPHLPPVTPEVGPGHVALAQVGPATARRVGPGRLPRQCLTGELEGRRRQTRPHRSRLGQGPGHPCGAVRQPTQGPAGLPTQPRVGPTPSPGLRTGAVTQLGDDPGRVALMATGPGQRKQDSRETVGEVAAVGPPGATRSPARASRSTPASPTRRPAGASRSVGRACRRIRAPDAANSTASGRCRAVPRWVRAHTTPASPS